MRGPTGGKNAAPTINRSVVCLLHRPVSGKNAAPTINRSDVCLLHRTCRKAFTACRERLADQH